MVFSIPITCALSSAPTWFWTWIWALIWFYSLCRLPTWSKQLALTTWTHTYQSIRVQRDFHKSRCDMDASASIDQREPGNCNQSSMGSCPGFARPVPTYPIHFQIFARMKSPIHFLWDGKQPLSNTVSGFSQPYTDVMLYNPIVQNAAIKHRTWSLHARKRWGNLLC